MKARRKIIVIAAVIAAVSLLLCGFFGNAVAGERPRDASPGRDISTPADEAGGTGAAPQGLLGKIWKNLTLKNAYMVTVKAGASYLGYYMSAVYPPIGITILAINGIHSIYVISKGMKGDTTVSSPKGEGGLVRPSDTGRPIVPVNRGYVYGGEGQENRTLDRNLPGDDRMGGSGYEDGGSGIKDYDWSEVERMRQDLDRESSGAGKEMEDYKRSIGLE